MTVKELRTLIDNLDEYIHVPGGIERLKKTVLHLAVSGQLVPQDPSEGTGEELYRQIQAEKGKLINNGKFKKQASLSKITEDETPFKIPDSWIWVRPAEIGYINPRNSIDNDLNVGFIPMTMISEDFGTKPQFDQRRWGEVKKNFTHFGNGDVIMAKITPCFENSKAGIIRDLPNNYGAGTTELHVFRQDKQFIAPKYFYIWIKNPTYLEIGKTKMTGSAGQKRVPTDFFAQFPFPLPPIGEQARIAEKVDTIFNLIDRLAAKYIAEQNERKKLVSVALAGLARGDSELAFTHLTEIIRTKADAAELRKTILHLAVSGQLVSQDLLEGSGEELYRQIQAEKAKLIREGILKPQKTLPPIKDSEMPFQIPQSWRWTRLGELTNYGTAEKAKPSDITGNTWVLELEDIEKDSSILLKKVDASTRNSLSDKNVFYKYDVLYGKLRPYLDKVIVADDGGVCSSEILPLRVPGGSIEPEYLRLCLKSPSFVNTVNELTYGVKMPRLGTDDGRKMPITLPPLAEQTRIVQKTTQLLDLVTELEKHLEMKR